MAEDLHRSPGSAAARLGDARRRRFGAVGALAACLLAGLVLGASAHAAFPGANGRIAFTKASEIHTMNPDGSGQAFVTWGTQPAVSPDGRTIAFSYNGGISIVNADGSARTGVAFGCAPAFSPDGRRIVFSSGNCYGRGEIAVANVDGSGFTRLTSGAARLDTDPVFSPDGRSIAFKRGPFFHNGRPYSADFEVYVMNADGSGQTNLTRHPADDGAPAFSPDGRTIAYESARDDSCPPILAVECDEYEIYVMKADGSGQTRLTHRLDAPGQHLARHPSFSPDGRRIAFASHQWSLREGH